MMRIIASRTKATTVVPYSWTATNNLVGGVFRSCSDPFQNYRIEISGQQFRATPERIDQWNSVTTMNLKSLKPDGSGRVTTKSPKGVVWNFDFNPGTGPRAIRVGSDYFECRYEWKPL